MRGEIFIDKAGLDNAISLYIETSKDEFIFDSSERRKLLELLFQKSILRINITADEIVECSKSNPYYMKLLKNSSLRSSNLHLDSCQRLNHNTLHFLTESNSSTEQYQEKFGLWFLSSLNLPQFRYPLQSKSYNFHSLDKFRNFDFLHKHKHPINSLIITDDYLFNDSKGYALDAIELNLKPILKRLIPKKLEEVFHLTIVCSGPSGVSLDKDLIRKEIELILKDYPFDCLIEFYSYKFHKRVLITNYAYIASDKGFRNLSFDKRNEGQKTWCEIKNDFEVAFIHDSENNASNYHARIVELNQLISDSKNRLLRISD